MQLSDFVDSDGDPLETLGMSEDDLRLYVEELVRDQARATAQEAGTTLEDELDSPGYAAVLAAMNYAVQLIHANNAYLTRQLLDLGILRSAGDQTA